MTGANSVDFVAQERRHDVFQLRQNSRRNVANFLNDVGAADGYERARLGNARVGTHPPKAPRLTGPHKTPPTLNSSDLRYLKKPILRAAVKPQIWRNISTIYKKDLKNIEMQTCKIFIYCQKIVESYNIG